MLESFRIKIAAVRAYSRENGVLWTIGRACTAVVYILRNKVYASQLHASPVALGRSPRIRGLRHISIGSNFQAGDFLWIEAVTRHLGIEYHPQIILGDNVSVSNCVHVGSTGRVIIGNGVLIGSRVIITDHNHGQYRGEHPSHPSTPPSDRPLSACDAVLIGNNVWIGDGVAILPGSTVGDGCVIGANSVVSGMIPPNCIAVGSPARPICFYRDDVHGWATEEIG